MSTTPGLIIDLVELFQKQFRNKPYIVPGIIDTKVTGGEAYSLSEAATKQELEFTKKGSKLREKYLGTEIFLPIRLYKGSEVFMYLPYCVVSISGANSWESTQSIELSNPTH